MVSPRPGDFNDLCVCVWESEFLVLSMALFAFHSASLRLYRLCSGGSLFSSGPRDERQRSHLHSNTESRGTKLRSSRPAFFLFLRPSRLVLDQSMRERESVKLQVYESQ